MSIFTALTPGERGALNNYRAANRQQDVVGVERTRAWYNEKAADFSSVVDAILAEATAAWSERDAARAAEWAQRDAQAAQAYDTFTATEVAPAVGPVLAGVGAAAMPGVRTFVAV